MDVIHIVIVNVYRNIIQGDYTYMYLLFQEYYQLHKQLLDHLSIQKIYQLYK